MMKGFKQFIESTFYHGTSNNNAEQIIKYGIDVSKYKSGMFIGFYLTPDLEYFQTKKPEVILACEIDDDKIMNVDDVTDEELEQEDASFRRMSFGYKNSLITRIAKKRGFCALRNGKEIVVFDKRCVRKISRL